MKSLQVMRDEILSRPPANDMIQDLLPDSTSVYMLICGRSGIGKTNLAFNILYCLASGTPFLSHKIVQCRVGYFSMEGSDAKILTRFDKLTASFDGADEHIYWHHCLPITLNEKGMDELKHIVTGLEVVIIDPLRPLVMGDYTSPKDAALFLTNLRKVQNDTGTKVILIHHIRKRDKRYKVYPEDLIDEVKGASEYVEGASTVLLLEQEKQRKDHFGKYLPKRDDYRTLYFTKVKDAPTDIKPLTLYFNRDTLLFEPRFDKEYEGEDYY